MIGLFREAAALEIQKQRLVPGRLSGRQHMGNPGADIRPDLRPDLVRPAADNPAAFEPDRRKIGVVAKERELGTPGHPHRETRGEHHVDDRLQAERPVLWRTKRRRRPIIVSHRRPDRTAAGEELQANLLQRTFRLRRQSAFPLCHPPRRGLSGGCPFGPEDGVPKGTQQRHCKK